MESENNNNNNNPGSHLTTEDSLSSYSDSRIKIDDIISSVVMRLKQLNPYKVFLFGSYAYGTPGEDSDLDLLIVTNDNFIPNNYKEKSDIYLQFAECLRDVKKIIPIDIIVHTLPMHEKFKQLGSFFSKEVIGKGRVIYEGNNKRVA
ncbi:MAG TPA: nucleotidyltransferase domain-containing protein [Candidatus Margulisbacteria bacterium]|nr:nucleotidyltransferase domain-containing protein [Candidatus Margulisiibacteriota bacterium]